LPNLLSLLAAFASPVQQANLFTLKTVGQQVMVDLIKLWLEWLLDCTARISQYCMVNLE